MSQIRESFHQAGLSSAPVNRARHGTASPNISRRMEFLLQDAGIGEDETTVEESKDRGPDVTGKL